MRTTRNIQKTLAAGLLSTSLLFGGSVSAQAQGGIVQDVATSLIKKAAEVVLGDALNSILGLGPKEQNPGATPEQVEEIVSRIVNAKIDEQTEKLQSFMIKQSGVSDYRDITRKFEALKNVFGSYVAIRTGYPDKLRAATEINNDINYLNAYIYAAMADQNRQRALPTLFFDLYTRHLSLIPLQIAMTSEIVINSNKIYDSITEKGGRQKSDGFEVVNAAARALDTSLVYWQYFYPGHLNSSGVSAVSNTGCVYAAPNSYIQTYRGDSLLGGVAYPSQDPDDLRKYAERYKKIARPPTDWTERHYKLLLAEANFPKQLEIASGQQNMGNGTFLVTKVCKDDLAMAWSDMNLVGETDRGARLRSFRLNQYYDPFKSAVKLQTNPASALVTNLDWEINPNAWYYSYYCKHQGGAFVRDPCENMFGLPNFKIEKVRQDTEAAGYKLANIGWYMSYNYWNTSRYSVMDNREGSTTGIFVGPHPNGKDGIGYNIKFKRTDAIKSAQIVKDYQVKIVSNGYGERFGGGKDLVRDTHRALLDLIMDYKAKNGASNTNGIAEIAAKALNNFAAMHCPISRFDAATRVALGSEQKQDKYCGQ